MGARHPPEIHPLPQVAAIFKELLMPEVIHAEALTTFLERKGSMLTALITSRSSKRKWVIKSKKILINHERRDMTWPRREK